MNGSREPNDMTSRRVNDCKQLVHSVARSTYGNYRQVQITQLAIMV
jgi:hypothetical protein